MTLSRILQHSLRRSSTTSAVATQSLSHLYLHSQNPIISSFTPSRSFSFSSPEEAAAERRLRKRRLRIEPPLHALRRDHNALLPSPYGYTKGPRGPETTSSLVGPRLSLHNRVQSLIRAGDLDNASVVARRSVFSSPRPTVFTCNAIIASMHRAKRYSDAIALFPYFFKQSNIVPNVVSYNILINTLCDSGEVDRALEVYQEIIQNPHFNPSSVTYRHLTKGLIDAGRISEAVDLLRQMLNGGQGADSLVFNNLISGFLNLENLEKANEFFDELKERCLVYDGVVNATYMEWFFSRGRDREAMESYKSLLDKNFRMHPPTCNALLEVLLRHGKKAEAEALFDTMLDNHTPPAGMAVNSDTFNIMVNECFRLGKAEEAYTVFKKAGKAPKSKPFSMDTAGFSNIIARYCENEMMGDAEKLYVELCGKSLSPDVNTYRNLIDAYFKLGRVDDALKKYVKMVEDGLRVIPTYANKWFSELIEKGKVAECASILTTMGKREPKPDAVTYDLVIRGLCSIGNCDTSVDLLGQMVNYGVGVAPALKEFVLEAYDKIGRKEEIEQLLNARLPGYAGQQQGYGQHYSNGVPQYTSTPQQAQGHQYSNGLHQGSGEQLQQYSSGLQQAKGPLCSNTPQQVNGPQYCIRLQQANGQHYDDAPQQGNGQQYSSGYAELCAKSLFLASAMDTAGFNKIIAMYCENEMLDEAEKLYVELCGKSLSPDFDTYRTLIDAYFKVGRVDDALEKYVKMVEAGLRVIPTYANKWFSELIEKGKVAECASILTKMGEREPKPDAVTYDLVIRELYGMGEFDLSLDLLGQMVSYGVGVAPALKEFVLEAYDKIGRKEEIERLLNARLPGYAEIVYRNGSQHGNGQQQGYSQHYSNGVYTSTPQQAQGHQYSNGLQPGNGEQPQQYSSGLQQAKGQLYSNTPQQVNGPQYSIGLQKANGQHYDNAPQQGNGQQPHQYSSGYVELCGKSLYPAFAMDTASFNNIIAMYCENEMMEVAEKLYVELCGKSLSPDVDTYRTLIDAYFKVGRVDDALEKYVKMVEAGLRVIPTYANKWFSELIEKGKVEECASILTKMGEREPKPDAVTYDLVIRELYGMGEFDLSLDLLGQMVNYGVGVAPALKEFVLQAFNIIGRKDEIERLLNARLPGYAEIVYRNGSRGNGQQHGYSQNYSNGVPQYTSIPQQAQGHQYSNELQQGNGQQPQQYSSGLQQAKGQQYSNTPQQVNGPQYSIGLQQANGQLYNNAPQQGNGQQPQQYSSGLQQANGRQYGNTPQQVNGLQYTSGLQQANGQKYSNAPQQVNRQHLSSESIQRYGPQYSNTPQHYSNQPQHVNWQQNGNQQQHVNEQQYNNGTQHGHGHQYSNGPQYSSGLQQAKGQQYSNTPQQVIGWQYSSGLQQANGQQYSNAPQLVNRQQFSNGPIQGYGHQFSNGPIQGYGQQYSNSPQKYSIQLQHVNWQQNGIQPQNGPIQEYGQQYSNSPQIYSNQPQHVNWQQNGIQPQQENGQQYNNETQHGHGHQYSNGALYGYENGLPYRNENGQQYGNGSHNRNGLQYGNESHNSYWQHIGYEPLQGGAVSA